MIVVKTFNEADGIRITTVGHATNVEGGPEGDAERIKVCAAISVLLLPLITLCSGSWGGDNSGYSSCVVPAGLIRHAEYVMAGILLIISGYPGQVRVDRADTRLFTDPETREWDSLELPKPPT